MSNWFLLGGSAALIASLASCWSHARVLIQQMMSVVVVSYDMDSGYTANILLSYLQSNNKSSRLGIRSFLVFHEYVRPHREYRLVAAEFLGGGGSIYWIGWKPLWVIRKGGAHFKDVSPRHQPIQVTCLRGTINIEDLMSEAAEFFSSTDIATPKLRYRVRHVTGSDGKPARLQSHEVGGQPSQQKTVSLADPEGSSLRPLKYDRSDLGPLLNNEGNALDRLALGDEAKDVVKEVRLWKESREWHSRNGIPWKRGFCLSGPPGTGKTALVRAIAEDFDLPVYVFDLATLYNDELRQEWSSMMVNAPCIAMFEDFDAVFNKRENKRGHLTFDCLLNCLDGIDLTNGLLTFITTNDISSLDEALGGGRPRPGRIDKVITMSELTDEGRRLIAKRILSEAPDEIEDIVKKGHGETGAQFVSRCTRRALEVHYSDRSTDGIHKA